MHKLPVGVLGASGYAGQELCRLADSHPHFDLVFAAAHSRAGEPLRLPERTITLAAVDAVPLADAAVIFSALHTVRQRPG